MVDFVHLLMKDPLNQPFVYLCSVYLVRCTQQKWLFLDILNSDIILIFQVSATWFEIQDSDRIVVRKSLSLSHSYYSLGAGDIEFEGKV